MKEYRVLKPIRFAARNYNAGEIVAIPDDRIEKYKNSIEPVETAKKAKESN